MEKRYRALRTIGTIYKVLGTIAGILTLLGVLAGCATSVLGGAALDQFGQDLTGIGMFGGVVGGVIFSLILALNGGLIALTLYSLGEGIYLFLAIEENTRYTAQVLSYQVNRSADAPVSNP